MPELEMVVCPVCKGEKTGRISLWHGRDAHGNSVGGARPSGRCTFCGGWGKVTAERMEMRAMGQAMRQERISRGLSVREEARRLGVDAQYLSGVESGRYDTKVLNEAAERKRLQTAPPAPDGGGREGGG